MCGGWSGLLVRSGRGQDAHAVVCVHGRLPETTIMLVPKTAFVWMGAFAFDELCVHELLA